MKNFLFQVGINYKRIVFRNLSFLFFSVALPIGFYLLFTRVFAGDTLSSKSWRIEYLISMATYSSLISSIFTVSNTLIDDQQHQFDLFIELSPISKIQYYLSMIIVFSSLNIISTIALQLVAQFINHVGLTVVQMLAMIFLLPILSIPILLMGIMLSLLGTSYLVNLLSNILVFPMAIASGLWWPLTMMPSWLQIIGKLLPPYQIAEITKAVVSRETLLWEQPVILIAWLVIISILIKLINTYREKNEVQTI